jgi:hypothetical protein
MTLPIIRPEGPSPVLPAFGGGAAGAALGQVPATHIVYNSYAGTDIVAEILLPGEKPLRLGELQTLSYSIHRENSPVRILGHTNAAGFVKGPRTIAGSLIFTVFDEYTFYRLEKYQKAIPQGIYPIADMLPPFDVVISFSNEYGVFSKMAIYGITIIDEGQTMSVDDLITEQTYTYMARGIRPLTKYNPTLPRESRIDVPVSQRSPADNVMRFF